MTDTIIMTTATRVRLRRESVEDGYSSDAYVDMGPSTTIDFYAYYGGPTGDTQTHVTIEEMDGIAFPGTGYIPSGLGTLIDVRPWVSAFVIGGVQIDWDGGTTGYHPEPTLDPFLFMESTWGLVLEDFGTSYPPPRTVCDAADDLTVTGGAWADDLQLGVGTPSLTHLIVTELGYQFTFSDTPPPDAAIVAPRRIFGRHDGATHGAKRVLGGDAPAHLIQRSL